MDRLSDKEQDMVLGCTLDPKHVIFEASHDAKALQPNTNEACVSITICLKSKIINAVIGMLFL